MAKYDLKFKLKEVKSYLNREGGYPLVTEQYMIITESNTQEMANHFGTNNSTLIS